MVILLLFVTPLAMSSYDSRTKKRVLGMIARELPHNASMEEMDGFMRMHTTRYGLIEYRRTEYAGFLPQSAIDRILADRAVQIILKVDRKTRTLDGAEVRIYYTGP